MHGLVKEAAVSLPHVDRYQQRHLQAKQRLAMHWSFAKPPKQDHGGRACPTCGSTRWRLSWSPTVAVLFMQLSCTTPENTNGMLLRRRSKLSYRRQQPAHRWTWGAPCWRNRQASRPPCAGATCCNCLCRSSLADAQQPCAEKIACQPSKGHRKECHSAASHANDACQPFGRLQGIQSGKHERLMPGYQLRRHFESGAVQPAAGPQTT